MSTLKAEIVSIDAIEKHPNADRLDLVVVKDWRVVCGRSDPSTPRYKVGDTVVYLPIDSILPPDLECWLFPPDSKITLSKSRIRTIKLRGAISQGMVISLNEGLSDKYPKLGTAKLGDDVTEILGIKKFEPDISTAPKGMQATSKRKTNPDFKAYTDIENFKHYPNIFEEGELVYITEKIHGTSARYAKLPVAANTFFKKILKFFRLLPTHEFCFGSRRVQLQDKPKNYKGFYEENVYAKIAEQLKLEQLLQPGEALYGEIVGHNIQKGYTYGCKEGEYKFYAYDVQVDGKYLDAEGFIDWCLRKNVVMVPGFGFMPFHYEVVDKIRSGDSTIAGQKVREGIVIKPLKERINNMTGRTVLKWINDDYLLKEQTDFQ